MRPKVLAAVTVLSMASPPAFAEELSRQEQLTRLLSAPRIESPTVSPDGQWVAYIFNDETEHIWMVPTAGGEPERLVDSQEGIADLSWSPNARWLAYVADDKTGRSQLWALPARMGEPRQITALRAGRIREYAWAPDGTQVAALLEGPTEGRSSRSSARYTGEPISLEYKDADIRDVLLKFSEISGLNFVIDGDVSGRVTLRLNEVPWDEALEGVLRSAGLDYTLDGTTVRIARLITLAFEKPKAPASEPLVIRALDFKSEGRGYRSVPLLRLVVIDVPSRKERTVDLGGLEAIHLAWAPDGRSLAFSGARPPIPPANTRYDYDLYLVPQDGSVPPRVLVAGPGDQEAPAFSPDGKRLAFRTEHDPSAYPYSGYDLALTHLPDGAWRRLGPPLDRDLSQVQFTADGKALLFLLEDGGAVQLVRMDVASGRLDRLVAGDRTVEAFSAARDGRVVVLEGDGQRRAELSIVAAGKTRLLVPVNKSLEGLALGRVERWRVRSTDDTWVDGFLVRPPNPSSQPGPGILWLHGGPNAQATASLDYDWHALAMAGYTVIAPNPRGSSGYGTAHAAAIKGAWGTHDFDDAMAAVDAAVSAGLVDPQRLGVGGWSYGGWLTNHILTRTTRFRAAVAGSGLSNLLADLGVSDTASRMEAEMGLPWENPEAWRRQSPWFDAQKVTTPTLVLCGQDDVRTPVSQSELWYFALRRLGVESELVIYPGEGHGPTRRSTAQDRIERTLAWFDRFLVADGPAPRPTTAPASP